MSKKKYTKEEIIRLIRLFIEKNNREPSFSDFCAENGLPNRKTVERTVGGLVNIRKEIGLYPDHRTGKIRSDVVDMINKRGMEWNTKIYHELLKLFSERDIHCESSIFDDKRNRTDFKVYGKKVFIVDIFYPMHRNSLLGCVGAKSRKYPENIGDYIGEKFDKIIFLNLNDTIVNDIPVNGNFSLMNLNEFWNYCKSMV